MFGAKTDLYFYNGNELSKASPGFLDLRKDSLFPFFVCCNLFNATPKDKFSVMIPTFNLSPFPCGSSLQMGFLPKII